MAFARAHIPENAGLVYFALCGVSKRVKIGYTHNLDRRIKALSAGMPDGVPLIAGVLVAEDPRGLERKIHKKFHHLRQAGEWFDFTLEIEEFVDRNTYSLEGERVWGLMRDEKAPKREKWVIEAQKAPRHGGRGAGAEP